MRQRRCVYPPLAAVMLRPLSVPVAMIHVIHECCGPLSDWQAVKPAAPHNACYATAHWRMHLLRPLGILLGPHVVSTHLWATSISVHRVCKTNTGALRRMRVIAVRPRRGCLPACFARACSCKHQGCCRNNSADTPPGPIGEQWQGWLPSTTLNGHPESSSS